MQEMTSRLTLPFRYCRFEATLVMGCVANILFLIGAVQALELSQYTHTSWTVRDGHLKAGVRCIAQTPDGYLWLGTEFGLVRFDGMQFVEWSPPTGQHLPSANIRSLTVGHDGTLWIGTLEGLTSWKDGRLTHYPQIGKQNILAITEDHEGTVWAGTFGVPKGQLCSIRHGEVQCNGDDGSFGEWVWSLYEDGDGRLWVGSEAGLWRWTPGTPKRYAMPRQIETSQAIVQLTEHSGPLVIGERIWQLDKERMKEYSVPLPPGGLTTPVNMYRDSKGGLWIGTLERGLLHVYEGKTSRFAETEGLSSDHVMSIFQDRENNIWVGTSDGLDRFHEPAVVSVSNRQGLSSPSVWAVMVARDNSVWITTLDGLNRWKHGRVTIYRSVNSESARQRAVGHARPSDQPGVDHAVVEKTDPGLPDDRVGSLYEDERGRIWVSTPAGIAYFATGRFTHVKELPPGWVNAITGDNHDGVWVSYENLGLVHWANGKVLERIPWSSLGRKVVASSVLTDPARGGLWLGFFEGGLVFLKDGAVRAAYHTSDGLGRGRVMGLELDGKGALWAATEGGLSHLQDGRIATLTVANGLPCNTVHWSVEVGDSFWMYTACGLLRVQRAEIEKWSADPTKTIRFTTFDSSDGVRIRALLSGYTPRVSKSADGKVWFSRLDGVSILDPHDLRINVQPPAVRIEQVIADDKAYEAKNGLRLPAGVRNLAIDYTATSLVAPEKVRFRYKLEGQNRNWHEVVNDREVQYTNLPPKRYRFRVLACNNSDVWNETGDTLEFVIPPMWYQTDWFYGLCAAAFLGLLCAAYQLRVRHLAREFNMRLEERVGERTRVARDLHDTLLQSFQGLLPRLQAAIYQLPEEAEKSRKTLEEAVDRAAEAITEGRDAVQGLRMSTVEQNDLAQAIETLGQELRSGTESQLLPEFRVVVEGASRSLHPILRDEVYRISAEALRNAFRHAAAKNVEVEIRYDQNYFRLRVRDDGKGIQPDVLGGQGREGHYGLGGMRERSKLVGGKLTIWTEVDGGTEIELVIPAARVYVKPPRRIWGSWKRSPEDTEEKEAVERE